jgi:TatD DNase family protein
MEFKYIDAHCHIQFDDYSGDTDRVIEDMRAQGVAGIVVGVDAESSRQAIALAEKHEHLFASVGWHPNYLAHAAFDSRQFKDLVTHPKVVAIGECGLDYYRPEAVDDEVKNIQRVALQQQIALAVECDKPLIIHARPTKGTADAYGDLNTILRTAKAIHGDTLRGDVHFFVGSIAEASVLRELGFTVSFTAVITFAGQYDAVVRTIPLESILAETDSPYVAPASRRGKRNDPLSVIDVVNRIAELRSEDPEMVRKTLFENARRLFNIG